MSERSAVYGPSSTSLNLVQGLRNREPEAWRRLVRLYGPLVYCWGRQCGLQDNDAADIMQDVLLSISQHIDRFKHGHQDNTFRGWLWVITRNQIRDFAADRNLEPQATGGRGFHLRFESLPETPPESPHEESRLGRRALEQVQGEFAPQVWAAFWRTAVEGDAPRDVAEDLDLTVWAVYKARSRVLQRLRQELGDPA